MTNASLGRVASLRGPTCLYAVRTLGACGAPYLLQTPAPAPLVRHLVCAVRHCIT